MSKKMRIGEGQWARIIEIRNRLNEGMKKIGG